MRRRVVTTGVALSLTACTGQGPQRTAISTPTSEQLKWARDQAKVTPARLGGAVAAGLAMQLSGLKEEEEAFAPELRRDPRFLDLARTDASEVPLTRSRHSGPTVAGDDPETPVTAGDLPPPATVPFILKLPPGMQ